MQETKDWLSGNRKQQRLGLSEIVRPYQQSAPQFVQLVLRHNFGIEQQPPETKRIPDSFSDPSTYKKTFHYLITNECIADLRQRLKKIEKTAPDPLKVTLQSCRTNNEGLLQVYLTQKQDGQGQPSSFQLQNYSLSRYRLGLICSSKEYRREYYGLPSSKGQEFAFLGLLVTP